MQEQFLPLAVINSKLSQKTINKRLQEQESAMHSVVSDQFSKVYSAFAKDILPISATDFSNDHSKGHIQFDLIECGRIHIDITIEGEVFVCKFGGGASFLPYAKPSIKFEGAYDSSAVSKWIIDAVNEVKASVIANRGKGFFSTLN